MKLLSAIACAAVLTGCAGTAPGPDTILINGKIFTANTEQPWVQAVAITGDRITAAGDTASIETAAGASTRRIDLGGRTVVPGFNDAHAHVDSTIEMHEVPLSQEPTTAEVAAALKTALESARPGVPIRVQIGGTVWDDAAVTRWWLDAFSPTQPLMLSAWSGHGEIVNSATLALAGIDESTPDPEGGRFQRDAEGRLNGRAEEYADLLITRRLSAKLAADRRPEAYRRFSSEAARLGITSVQAMAHGGLHKDAVADVVAADSPLRWRVIRWPMRVGGGETSDSKTHLPPQPSPRVDARGMKWMLDGTPIERLAAMRQPYADRASEQGRINFNDDRIQQFVGWAYGSEDPLAVHAVGDRTIETLLSALERGGRPEVWQRKRPRLEHGDMLMPDLMPRARALGIVVVQNPSHLMLRETLEARLGAERLAMTQPMKSLLQNGIRLAIGSDGPLNPFLNIMFATIHAVNPPERLTREEAVTAYTYGSAYAEFTEREKGRLVPGALADLAVLSADLFSVPPEQLPSLHSVLTLIGGQPVHNGGLWQP
jgi:predicted amidohydrolase YtcJ